MQATDLHLGSRYDDADKSSRPDLPAPIGRSLLFIIIALATGLGLTLWFQAARSQSFTGHLNAETTIIRADRDARIDELLIEEGQVLNPGDLLARLVDEGLESKINSQRLQVASLETELEQAHAKADVDLRWRTKDLEAEILQTRLQATTFLKTQFDQQVQKQAWQDFVAGKLSTSDDPSPDDVFKSVLYLRKLPEETQLRAMIEQESSRNAAEVSAVQVQLCDLRVEALEKLKSVLPERIRRATGIDVLESRLKAAQQELNRLEAGQRTFPLKTPAYGTVGIFRQRAGDRILAGETVVEVFDEDRRFLDVHIPSRSLSRFLEGTEVVIRFPGGELRQGVVRHIPPQTKAPVGAGVNSPIVDTVVLIRVEPRDKLWPNAPIGSAVAVTLRN